MIMYDTIFEQNICLHIRILFIKQSTYDSRGTKYSRRMYAAGDTRWKRKNKRTRRVKKSMAYKYGCSNNSGSFIAQQYEIDVLISAFFILLYRVGSFISELTDRISCDFLHISYDRVGKWLDLSEK